MTNRIFKRMAYSLPNDPKYPAGVVFLSGPLGNVRLTYQEFYAFVNDLTDFRDSLVKNINGANVIKLDKP